MEKVPQGIRLETVLRFVDVATEALAEAREEIDALNVYPVPDGDTGTNMFLTFSAARDAIREALDGAGSTVDSSEITGAMAAFRRAALMNARGNSGVILSQMLAVAAQCIERAQDDDFVPQVLAELLSEAADASWAAVAVPVEGTILSVIRAASDAAEAVLVDEGELATSGKVLSAAAEAARVALARTPEQLQILADSGVVDAGGRGLVAVLNSAEQVITGRVAVPSVPRGFTPRLPVPGVATTVAGADLTEGGPAYEVMYLLDGEAEAVETLKKELGALGDSLVIVGGDMLWNVHVHVDDVGAAIEAGMRAGRPHRIKVTHFAEQIAARRSLDTTRTGRRIVAVAAGDGLRNLFGDAGAQVVDAVLGQRPSTGEILAAIDASGAAEVLVLPNDPDSIRVAEMAAHTAEETLGVRVVVIPTQAQVQGLAALAVHEPGRSLEADVLEMTATARHARHGAVTVAAKKAMTTAGPCEPGDVLGVIDGDFAIIGTDLFEVAREVIARLLGAGGDLVTLVSGRAEYAEALARRAETWVEENKPLADVVVYDGGQPRYPLLVSVE